MYPGFLCYSDRIWQICGGRTEDLLITGIRRTKMDLIKIKCQETACPYGKKEGQRCLFGEIYEEDLRENRMIRERHKCPRAKTGKLQFVTVFIKTS